MPLNQPYKVLIDRIINHNISWSGNTATVDREAIILPVYREAFFAELRNGTAKLAAELRKAHKGNDPNRKGYDPNLDPKKYPDRMFEKMAAVFGKIEAGGQNEEAYRFLKHAIAGLLKKEEDLFCERIKAAVEDPENDTLLKLKMAVSEICMPHEEFIHDTY